MLDTLLVIEDEPLLGAELREEFAASGWDAVLATDLAEAERLLAVRHLEPLVVVSDMSLPDGNAMDLLERIRPMGSAGEWIFLTAYGGVPESVRALKIGAFDFLEKPCDTERLQLVVTGAARSARAQRRLSEEARVRSSRFTPTAYVGRSRPAQQVRDMLGRLARVPCTALLITGETGTGKGLAARILHHAGPRRGAPFVEINCATLPRELMEAELFGHEAGAFPGAEGPHRGLLEQANGGTLFLGEIGELQLGVQAKLLTAIEDRRVRRLGTDRELEIDLQVIAATIQELEVRVAKGTFHADLYHRLAVCRLAMPPLRSRKEDLEDLLPLFIGELNACCGRRVVTIPPAVWRRLAAYDWPGNVRELRNLVERCVLLANGPVFPERWLHLGEEPGAGDAAPSVSDHSNGLYLPLDGSVSLDQMERRILCEALARNGDDVNLTARLLGTTQDKLRYGVQKYGLRTSD